MNDYRGQTELERIKVAAHYENDPEIFRIMLGRRRAYSVGIWQNDDDSLDDAQEKKCASIAHRLALRPGERALDAGCGWGSVALYLAEHTGAHIDAITLSSAQKEVLVGDAARIGAAERVAVHKVHFEDFEAKPESYDAVYFVGSIVHMDHREEVLARAASLLRPGGRLFISDCYFPIEQRGDRDSRANRYILHEVLGYCRLRPLTEELGDLEKFGLDILHVQNLTDAYVRTIDAWINNIRKNRKTINERAPGFAHILQSYLTVARRSFYLRAALEYMVLAEKPGGDRRIDPARWSVP